MQWLNPIIQYIPVNEQEVTDQQSIVDFCRLVGNKALLRSSTIAHVTASSFVVNPQKTHALMAHHNLLGCFAWTGGHADGNSDLLQVALQETQEETGVVHIRSLSSDIAALDILMVSPHIKKGVFVGAHLHLSVAYLLEAKMEDTLTAKPDENSDVRWIPLSDFNHLHFSSPDVRLYQKLIQKALLLT